MVTVGRVDIEVESVLDDLGVEVVDKGDNLLCKCPFHEDSHRSFAVSAKNGAWICYAGCGEGGMLKLVMEVQGVDHEQAKLWLEDRGTLGGNEDKVLQLLEDPEEAEHERKLYFYETGSTYGFMPQRGFTTKTLKAWSVGRDTPKQSVVLPINFDGRLVGLIYRHIYPEVDPPYEYTYGLKKSQLLFGWDLLPERPEKIYVVEGPLDAMWLWQYGYPGVAVLGSRLARQQADLLIRRTREVVLAFDNDEVGQRAVRHAMETLSGQARLSVVRWPPGRKDAQECGEDELRLALDNPVDAVLWGI